MGAFCGKSDIISKRLKEFLKNYPHYNNEEKSNSKAKKTLEGQEVKLYEHYKAFMKYKDELMKTNKNLHNAFFLRNDNINSLEVSGLKADDETKFLFFFNLRKINTVVIKNSILCFPKFSCLYFPKFRPTDSELTHITINDSEVLFEEVQEPYNRLRKVIEIDLSYNNIEFIPQFFKKFILLQKLILRRNLLSTLNPQIANLKNLKELDLSENKLKKVPEVVYELPKLTQLNLNNNMIDSLDFNKKNNTLNYLFLANNFFVNIPHDALNFTELTLLALDSNKISEINLNLLNECKSNLKITLANNLIKNREGMYQGFKNDILTITPETATAAGSKSNMNVTKDSEEELVETKKEKTKLPNESPMKRVKQVKIQSNQLLHSNLNNEGKRSLNRLSAKGNEDSNMNDSLNSSMRDGIESRQMAAECQHHESRKKSVIEDILYKNRK